jgi:cell division protease FtsH
MAEKKKRSIHFDLVYLLGALLVVLVVRDLAGNWSITPQISYSEFKSLLNKHAIDDLVIGDTVITGKYLKPSPNGPESFQTTRVDDNLAKELQKSGIKFSGEAGSGIFGSFLSWLLPTVGFIFLWMLLLRPFAGDGAGAGGLLAIGRSKAKVYAERDLKVTFADVAGVDEAKQELAEVVGFLKNPLIYGRLGARIPKGVLLVGPPGTGKTLLARAVAGEANVPFFSITGSEFVEMFVGVGAARVRDLFTQARASAPAIVFIDELDALGRSRGMDTPLGGHDEKEQTLNQLLAEMDGFDPSAGIIVLAATNRPEILDPALLRAGRFDRQVLVDRPDKKGRAEILRVHIKKIQIAPGLDVDAVAALTPGFTGADLANLVNEAALVATRRGGESTNLEDFNQAIERIVAGLEKKSRILTKHERQIVAHHEMGHTLVAMALPGTDPVQKVSIIPRGIAGLGYTMQRPIEDRFILDRTELFNRIAVLLGGRAAESLVFDQVSTGASDDLARATELARSMIVRYGMVSELGQVSYESEAAPMLGGQMSWRPRAYGDETAAAIDRALKDLIASAFETARNVLMNNRQLLDDGAGELLAHETLGQPDLEKLAARINRQPSVPTALAAQ